MSRILLVAHDNSLRESRALVLRHAGHSVIDVASVGQAVAELRDGVFDLVVIGRNPMAGGGAIDRVLREAFPNLQILKVANAADEEFYASRLVDASPIHILAAVKEMVLRN
jgi:DNA-binding response OmpR family regulator